MTKKTAAIFSLLILLVCTLSIPIKAEEEMPLMGPPEQISELSWMVGTWDVDQRFRMEESDTNWIASKGVAVYTSELNGSMIKMEYTSEMMGMPFAGTMLMAFDRIAGKWQSIWIDNMSARMSYYEGTHEGNQTVLGGPDYNYDGSMILARIVTFNETPDSFDWKMEMSTDNGATYWLTGEAKYTKRK